jgi:hypothetical protein
MLSKKISIITDKGRIKVSSYVFPLHKFDSRFQCFLPFTANLNLVINQSCSNLIGIYLDNGLLISSFNKDHINQVNIIGQTLEKLAIRAIIVALNPILYLNFERLETIFNDKKDCFERSFADLSA